MELQDVIWSKLYKKQLDSLKALVNSYVTTQKNASTFIKALLMIYATYFLNNNIWPLLKTVILLQRNTKARDLVRTKDSILSIIYLYSAIHEESSSLHTLVTFDLPTITKEETDKIIDISHNYDSVFANMLSDDLKNTLNGNIYNLLCFLQECLIKKNDYYNISRTIAHLSNLKIKQIFFKYIKGVTIYDIMFQQCLDNVRKKPDLYKFISICRDMYDYCNNKNIILVKFVYVSYYVALKEKIVTMKYNVLHNNDFLFTFHEYDDRVRREIDHDVDINKKNEQSCLKLISFHVHEPLNVDIIKQ